ncbi:MAG: NADH-quinone oxidoreductase subunit NuoE [Thermodesulfobacteriota bacterium]|nr:NADH-quinone oxidoreductase subunit NuoE [Thermodesulfobacteriota bacterium]
MEKEELNKLEEILAEFKGEKWPIIPALQRIQEEFGYIPRETIEPISKALNLFPSQVQGVATFYAQFYLTPRGKNLVRVCRGTACHVRGGKTILKLVKKHLDIEDGETTEDLKFSLETVACLGTCFLAPVMMVNRNYFGKLSPQRVNNVLKQY